jgi:hypothetical protein
MSTQPSFQITYLDRTSAINLIREPIPDKSRLPKYDDDAVEEILRLTRGQPFLIQAMCSVLFARINQSNSRQAFVTVDMVEQSIEMVFEQYEPYFQDYWSDAGHDGQPILLRLAEESEKLEDINRPILRDLERRLIIERDSQGVYQFQIPLFREWILMYEL